MGDEIFGGTRRKYEKEEGENWKNKRERKNYKKLSHV